MACTDCIHAACQRRSSAAALCCCRIPFNISACQQCSCAAALCCSAPSNVMFLICVPLLLAQKGQEIDWILEWCINPAFRRLAIPLAHANVKLAFLHSKALRLSSIFLTFL